jgi:hypothetical protein
MKLRAFNIAALAFTMIAAAPAEAGWRRYSARPIYPHPVYRSGPPVGAIIAGTILGAAALAGAAAYAYPIYDAPYPLYPAPRRVLKCGVYEDVYGQAIQRCDWVRAR